MMSTELLFIGTARRIHLHDRALPGSCAGIAFRLRDDRGGAFDIWIHNVRTGESKALVTGPSNDQDPSGSPDGEHIVYKYGPNANADICIVDTDGSHLNRIIEGDEPDTAPAWTPR